MAIKVFHLAHADDKPSTWTAKIFSKRDKNYIPVVKFENRDGLAPLYIQDEDLEDFAVSILKALKSKKLK